jgi:hypothetical protein
MNSYSCKISAVLLTGCRKNHTSHMWALVLCLSCSDTISIFPPFCLKCHFSSEHKDYYTIYLCMQENDLVSNLTDTDIYVTEQGADCDGI